MRQPPAAERGASAAAKAAGDGSTRLLRPTLLMAAGTFVSRILGMVRALLVAGVLGLLTLSSNAFTTANTVPNSLYLLVAGGLLNAALVPQITRAASSPDGGERALNRLLTLAIAGLLAVTVVAVLAAPLVPTLLAASFDPATARLTVALAYWAMPQVFFYGVYALAGQVLNAKGVFGPYTWAPVVNNVVAIAGLLAFLAAFGDEAGRQAPQLWTDTQIAVLAGSSTAGVALQAAVLLPALRRAGVRLRPRWRSDPADRMSTLGRVAGWTLGAAALNQLGYLVTSNVSNAGAAEGGAGRTVWDNAYLLLMLPHSLITVSLVTALFTRLSQLAQRDDVDAVAAQVARGSRLIVLAIAPTAVALVVLAPEMTQVLYPGNSAAEQRALAVVVSVIGLALVPLSLQHLLQRAFYAYQDARTPFLVQVVVIGTSSSLALLGWVLLPDRLVVAGVAAGLAVGLAAGVGASLLRLRPRLGSGPAHALADVLVRAGVAALVAGGCAVGVRFALATVAGTGWSAGAIRLVAGGVVLVLAYGAVVLILRVPEARAAVASARRRVGARRR